MLVRLNDAVATKQSGTQTSHEPFLHPFGKAHFIIRNRARMMKQLGFRERSQVPANTGIVKEQEASEDAHKYKYKDK